MRPTRVRVAPAGKRTWVGVVKSVCLSFYLSTSVVVVAVTKRFGVGSREKRRRRASRAARELEGAVARGPGRCGRLVPRLGADLVWGSGCCSKAGCRLLASVGGLVGDPQGVELLVIGADVEGAVLGEDGGAVDVSAELHRPPQAAIALERIQ